MAANKKISDFTAGTIHLTNDYFISAKSGANYKYTLTQLLTPIKDGSFTLTAVDIDGGAINGTTIGAASASTGAFTILSASSLTLNTDLAITEGGTGASSAVDARTNLGLVIGTNIQAHDTALDDISGLAVTDGNIIVGNGTNWVAESGATARTSLGLSIGSDVQAYHANLAAISGGTWTGATSITTLGTIGTGTWQGTAIADAYIASTFLKNVVEDTTPQLGGALDTNGNNIDISASNIVTDTTTGTKIGTSTSQKIGFFNQTPATQPGAPTTEVSAGAFDASVPIAAIGTPDYVLQDTPADPLTTASYGFASADEFRSFVQIVYNIWQRQIDIAGRLQTLGLTA